MSFENIRREDFDGFVPPHLVLERLMKQQVEWFSNKLGNIIGTIAGKEDIGWSYVVLKGDRKGNFRVCSLGGDSYNLKAARSRFLLELEATEKIDEAIARQEKREAAAARPM